MKSAIAILVLAAISIPALIAVTLHSVSGWVEDRLMQWTRDLLKWGGFQS